MAGNQSVNAVILFKSAIRWFEKFPVRTTLPFNPLLLSGFCFLQFFLQLHMALQFKENRSSTMTDTVTKSMTILTDIFEHNSFAKRSAPPKTDVTSIESALGFTLPQDYVFYILNYLGYEDFIGQEYVRLWDLDELVEMNKGYQIQNYLPSMFGIGGNGGGEMIALEYKGSVFTRVVLIPFIVMIEEDAIEIGNSFADFLVRLQSGRGWFA